MRAALLALAVPAAGEWWSMPNGLEYHESCIHRYDSGFSVSDGPGGSTIVTSPAGREAHGPCPYPPRRPKQDSSASYYSDWAVYAQQAHTQGLGFLSSQWQVPKQPTSHGPVAGMSSVYIFNGVEDGSGHHGNSTLILQPVLQVGKSGCLLSPTEWFDWHLTAYGVSGAGRAYCGKRLKVAEGETVVGNMTLTDPATNTWDTVAARPQTGEVSLYSSKLGATVIDAAYLTLEMMVCYSCKAYPQSGSVAFTRNELRDRSMQPLPQRWVKEVRHSECGQAVDIAASEVTLSWKTS